MIFCVKMSICQNILSPLISAGQLSGGSGGLHVVSLTLLTSLLLTISYGIKLSPHRSNPEGQDNLFVHCDSEGLPQHMVVIWYTNTTKQTKIHVASVYIWNQNHF